LPATRRKSGFLWRVVAVTLVLGFLVAEGGARLAFLYKDEIRKHALGYAVHLRAEWIADPNNPQNWLLKPGYSATRRQYYETYQKLGYAFSMEEVEQRAKKLGIPENEVVFRINRQGFKGPDIDASHSRPRILALGDSVTHGSIYDKYSYPRVLERQLRDAGLNVEVINGGVPGYSAANLLFRIDEFKALKPEITTIFVGWNSLYADQDIRRGLSRHLYSLRLVEGAGYKIYGFFAGYQRLGLSHHNRTRILDRHAVAVKELDQYISASFQDIEKLVTEMRSAGSRVVLVTLPGLFVMDETPTERARTIGHLPPFTENPYVLAKMTERYNAGLRELAGREGLAVVDLDEWSKVGLQPRDRYFGDSVHLFEEGEVLIGRKMAADLLPLVAGLTSRSTPTPRPHDR
jgi:lysophospholipase L1-like esterase